MLNSAPNRSSFEIIARYWRLAGLALQWVRLLLLGQTAKLAAFLETVRRCCLGYVVARAALASCLTC